MSHHDGPEGVHQRRFHFCARLGGIYELQDLFQVCPNCERFFARCCHHDLEARAPQSGSVRQQEEQVCHHWPVIFTDGSCLGNGTSTPRGGIGYALGAKANDQFSLPFDVNEHGLGPPTSQMMELLAAIAAVDNFKKRWLEGPHRAVGPDANFTGDVELVVAADSEYVAIGISEWYPAFVVYFTHSLTELAENFQTAGVTTVGENRAESSRLIWNFSTC